MDAGWVVHACKDACKADVITVMLMLRAGGGGWCKAALERASSSGASSAAVDAAPPRPSPRPLPPHLQGSRGRGMAAEAPALGVQTLAPTAVTAADGRGGRWAPPPRGGRLLAPHKAMLGRGRGPRHAEWLERRPSGLPFDAPRPTAPHARPALTLAVQLVHGRKVRQHCKHFENSARGRASFLAAALRACRGACRDAGWDGWGRREPARA